MTTHCGARGPGSRRRSRARAMIHYSLGAGTLAFFLLVTAFPAAGFELVRASYEYIPSAELDLTGAEPDEVQTSATMFTARLLLPVPIRGRETILVNRFVFRVLHQMYEEGPRTREVFRPDNLYTLRWGLGLRQTLGDTWRTIVFVQPSLLTDFEEVDAGHLSYRAALVFEQDPSPTLSWGFGIGYGDDYGDRRVLPVLQLNWVASPQWTVEVDLPKAAAVWRRMGRAGARVGFTARVTGGNYRIGEEVILPGGGSTKDGRVKYSIVNVGPAVALPVGRGVEVLIQGGFNAYRRYEVFDANDDQLLDSRFENPGFLNVTLSFDLEA